MNTITTKLSFDQQCALLMSKAVYVFNGELNNRQTLARLKFGLSIAQETSKNMNGLNEVGRARFAEYAQAFKQMIESPELLELAKDFLNDYNTNL